MVFGTTRHRSVNHSMGTQLHTEFNMIRIIL